MNANLENEWGEPILLTEPVFTVSEYSLDGVRLTGVRLVYEARRNGMGWASDPETAARAFIANGNNVQRL